MTIDMFTGLIEEVGTLRAVDLLKQGEQVAGATITVKASTVLGKLSIGDSIAIDGACMTVTARTEATFSFEVSPESLDKTHFSTYTPGKRVNLERPLTPSSFIGGHYVTGHVEGLVRIASRETDGNCERFGFDHLKPAWEALLVPKGSVAVLGISLTVNTVLNGTFSVAVIPHTLSHTSLSDYKVGDWIPLETDLLGKHVQQLLKLHSAPGITPSGQTNFYGPTPAQPNMSSLPSIRMGGWFNAE
jgi:riboflavin synthase